MALSGIVETTKYQGRYYELSWTAEQDTAKNESTISWTLSAKGGTSEWYAERTLEVKIDGAVEYTKTSREVRYKGVIETGTTTLKHDSTTGKKSFTISVRAAVYGETVNCTGSKTFTLDTIPRGATITAAVDFTDEDSPTISYSNPLGDAVDSLSVCISLDGYWANIPYRAVEKTSTSYTFKFTDEEKETIYEQLKEVNSKTVYFYILTVIDGVEYRSRLGKKLSIVNAKPTLTATVKDAGAASVQLTGNNLSIIKGFNYVSAVIEATPKKGADIISYKITNGNNTVNKSNAIFENTEDNKFICTITDSRKNTVTKEITLPMVNYVPLTAHVDAKIQLSTAADSTSAEIECTISGNYFNGSFGAKNNTLRVEIAIEQNGESFSKTIIDVPADVPESALNGNTYTITHTVNDLSYKVVWDVKAVVKDAINTLTVFSKKLKAIPVFDWSEEDFNFNVPLMYNSTKKLVCVPGDSITFSNNEITVGGMVANGSKDLYFTIPINKLIVADSAEVSGSVMCRGVPGYANSGTALTAPSGTTATITPAGVSVKMPFTSAIISNANNTPIAVTSYGLTITFK